jgi:uncharacterized protein (UPF0261 family)
VLVPLGGVSLLDGDGQPFCDRAADEAIFAALRERLHPEIPFETVDRNINDEAFAKRAVELLLQLVDQSRKLAVTSQGVSR